MTSQQTLVTVPVISTVSNPRERSRYGSSHVPGMNALKRYLRTISSSGRTSSSGQSSWPLVPSLIAAIRRCAARGRQHGLRVAPFVGGAFVEGVLDPEHTAAHAAHHRREPVHVGHDVARHRTDRMPDRIVHECVLQIDHDQRRASRIEIGVRMCHATTCDHTLGDAGWNVEPVHAPASTPSAASSAMIARRRASSSSIATRCRLARNAGDATNPL